MKNKKIIFFGVIAWPIWFITIICILTGTINITYYGFAVDDNGLLYVGKAKRVDVYDNGKLVNTIYKTVRGYRFTIHDEKLYVATDYKVKILDLSGNPIETIEDSLSREWDRFNKQRKVFITDDAKYKATKIFGFYKITKHNNSGENEIVYLMPILDFVMSLAIVVITILFVAIFFVWYIKGRHFEKRKK